MLQNNSKWHKLLKESYDIKDAQKANWIARYAQIHEAYEKKLGRGMVTEGEQAPGAWSGGGIFATPLNTMGMGNVAAPVGGDPWTTQADFHGQVPGSGDIPLKTTLPIALNVAATTVGFDLVAVVPSPGPWGMLTYLDFPYAGGKMGRRNEIGRIDGKGPLGENKPIYVKFKFDGIQADATSKKTFAETVKKGDFVTVECAVGDGKPTFFGRYIGNSRNGMAIFKVLACGDGYSFKALGSPADYTDVVEAADPAAVVEYSLIELAKAAVAGIKVSVFLPSDLSAAASEFEFDDTGNIKVFPVATGEDRVLGFANFAKQETFGADGSVTSIDGAEFVNNGLDPMSRGQNETGTGNTIGAQFYSKMVAMGNLEVTGTLTRQQLQDMPLYGVDVQTKLLEQMQGELAQQINAQILDHLWKLGVTNAADRLAYDGVNLNLTVANYQAGPALPVPFASSSLANSGTFYWSDVTGKDLSGSLTFPTTVVNSAEGYRETFINAQRRVVSKCLAAGNIITQVGRRGRPNFILTNSQVISALQDVSGFVAAPFSNSLTNDGTQSLYFAGQIAGLNVYCDPYMDWQDTRILVGRKGDGETPGVVFMPYILADTVQIIAEGTMSQKYLVNSRFAIVDAGFNPQYMYLAFAVDGTLV